MYKGQWRVNNGVEDADIVPAGELGSGEAGLWWALTNPGFNGTTPAAVLNRSCIAALEFPKPGHECPSSGGEPGFGTMCSNQGAGRGRFRGSLSPDHCLTTPDSLAGREGGVGGGRIMEFSHSFLSTGPLVSTTLCWRMETLSIKNIKMLNTAHKKYWCAFSISSPCHLYLI